MRIRESIPSQLIEYRVEDVPGEPDLILLRRDVVVGCSCPNRIHNCTTGVMISEGIGTCDRTVAANFIDGRMAIWTNHHVWGESNNAFKEYLDVVSGKGDFAKLAQKYQIQIVVWHSTKKENLKKPLFNNPIIHYLQNLLSPSQNQSFLEKVQQAGFKKAYQDDIAVIYIK